MLAGPLFVEVGLEKHSGTYVHSSNATQAGAPLDALVVPAAAKVERQAA